jgi:hypothetical protein
LAGAASRRIRGRGKACDLAARRGSLMHMKAFTLLSVAVALTFGCTKKRSAPQDLKLNILALVGDQWNLAT